MMDAVEFAKEMKRMIEYSPRKGEICYDIKGIIRQSPEFAVRIVEEWSKAHPIQTNGMKLKKDFGLLGVEKVFNAGRWMYALPEQWWNAPYEAPKGD